MDNVSQEEKIRVRAYELWKKDGSPDGRADEQAQAQIDEEEYAADGSGSGPKSRLPKWRKPDVEEEPRRRPPTGAITLAGEAFGGTVPAAPPSVVAACAEPTTCRTLSAESHCHRGEEAPYYWPFCFMPPGLLLTSLFAPLFVPLFRPLLLPLSERSILGISRAAPTPLPVTSGEP
jgi:Protein of unknown function (DUF2934)